MNERRILRGLRVEGECAPSLLEEQRLNETKQLEGAGDSYVSYCCCVDLSPRGDDRLGSINPFRSSTTFLGTSYLELE